MHEAQESHLKVARHDEVVCSPAIINSREGLKRRVVFQTAPAKKECPRPIEQMTCCAIVSVRYFCFLAHVVAAFRIVFTLDCSGVEQGLRITPPECRARGPVLCSRRVSANHAETVCNLQNLLPRVYRVFCVTASVTFDVSEVGDPALIIGNPTRGR